MKPLIVSVCALGLWASAALPVSAAWDNVFQPTLFGRCRRPATTTTQYYAPPVVVQSSPVVALTPACNTCNSPPPAPACQQQSCNTSYTQRCYYQPVTTYATQTYYEPVTSYQTSYYYEPVTSYRYSAYYDACSCGYQQVATPVTSYQLRAQSSPVQSWVQRCAQVPQTSYQKSCYWQPQTTCCTTTNGAPVYAVPAPVAVQPPQVNVAPSVPQYAPQYAPSAPQYAPSAPQYAPPAPPQVNTAPSVGPLQQPAPSISESRVPTSGAPQSDSMYDRYYPRPQQLQQTAPTMPPASWRPSAAPAQPTAPPPAVKLEQIVIGPDAHIEGRVVRSDNSPRANARVLFVNTALGSRQSVTANTSGRFEVQLTPGNWLVYLHGADDMPLYHSRFDVGQTQQTSLTLVNR